VPNFFEILGILSGASALALGIFTLVVNPRNPIDRSFSALAIFLGIWLFANTLSIPIEFTRSIALFAASLFTAANLHFAQKLINNKNIFLTITFYFLGIILIVFGATMTNTISDWSVVTFENGGKIWLTAFLVFWITPIFWLFLNSQKTIGTKKYQLWLAGTEHFIFLIMSVGLLLFTDNPTLSLEMNVVGFLNLLGIFHLLFIFYFFVEYNFLKLKIIFPSLLKKTFALMLATIFAITFQLILSIIFSATNSILINFATTIIAIITFNLTIYILNLYRPSKIMSFEGLQRVVDNFKNQNIFYASLEELKKNIQEKFAKPSGVRLTKIIVLDLEDGTALYPELEKYFTKNTSYLVTVEEEYLKKNKNVECPYLEELKKLGDVIFPLFQNTNELIGFFAIQRDVSGGIYAEEELKLIESVVHYVALALMVILYTEKLREQAKKLREDYEELKMLDDAKDAFISNVSHELRTPATAIKGYLEMLVAPNFGELNSKQKDFAERIQKNTNWLINILNDILTITKLDSRQIDFKLEDIALQPFFESLAAKWQPKIEAKNLCFEIAELKSDFILQTDPKRLEEILDCLLDNALKFTENGRIRISTEKSDNFLNIKISDTGKGIEQKNLEKIFEKFFQTENYLEKGDNSTGLGLAIAKKLVENLGGSISVKSRVDTNTGSTFQILIPLQNA